MVINLDKTDLMYMGRWINRPPILPQPLRINIVDPNSQLRYLGVMIGNVVPKDIAWTRVKSKVIDTIVRTQTNRPTLTERTLITNSVVTGNMLYGVAASRHSREESSSPWQACPQTSLPHLEQQARVPTLPTLPIARKVFWL